MTTSPVPSITEELLAELDALLGLNANGSLSTPLPYLSRVLLEKSAEHIRSLEARLEKVEKDRASSIAVGRRAIGDHCAPNDCYATGPLTGNAYLDLVECPACAALAEYDRIDAAVAQEASHE